MNKREIAVLTAGLLLMAAPAYAYVDPATGGVLVQLVTGGVAGAVILLRLYWRRLKEALGRGGRRPLGSEPPSTSSIDAGDRK